MMIEKRYKEIPKEIWEETSQNMELAVWKNHPGIEDRNTWWKEKFNHFKDIENEPVHTIFEVGCGPFAKNIQNVISVLKTNLLKSC